jgi:predicted RNA-binding Zn-ribbon protein involved in translation (DUF1610 family)
VGHRSARRVRVTDAGAARLREGADLARHPAAAFPRLPKRAIFAEQNNSQEGSLIRVISPVRPAEGHPKGLRGYLAAKAYSAGSGSGRIRKTRPRATGCGPQQGNGYGWRSGCPACKQIREMLTEGGHPMTMADRIWARIGRHDGRHRQTVNRHRDLDDTLGGVRKAATRAAVAGVEQDAPEVAADFGRGQARLAVPDTIDFRCPDCGTPLTAFRKRRMRKGLRGATYSCADCPAIWEVSWGAGGEDVQATAV